MKYLKLWFEKDEEVTLIARETDVGVIESISIRNKKWIRNEDIERKKWNDNDYEELSSDRAKGIIERILHA